MELKATWQLPTEEKSNCDISTNKSIAIEDQRKGSESNLSKLL